MVSERAIRAGWEAERANIEKRMREEMKFNPKAIHKACDNFIDSMVFARIPCTTLKAIACACEIHQHEHLARTTP